MAINPSVAGLFGTGIGSSREDIMQRIMQEQQSKNIARTQNLGKYAGLAQGGMETAQQFTRGVGQLFGVEDPRLQKQSQIEAAAQAVRDAGVDVKDPLATYEAFSQELMKRGLYGEATALIPKIQEAQQNAELMGIKRTELGIKKAGAARDAAEAERKELEFYKKNPEQTATVLQNLAAQLAQDPTNKALLDRYNKIAAAGTSGAIAESEKAEKESLETKKIQSIIDKNRKELSGIGSDFNAGARWNFERESAIKLLESYGYKPGDKLKGSDQLNAELQNAQTKALREPWGAGATPAQPAAPTTGSPKVIDFSQLPQSRP